MQIRELLSKLEEKYPLSLQEEWDNSGLQIGNIENELKNVLVSLDLEDSGIDKAIDSNCNLIITHHPYLFNSLHSIDLNKKFYSRLEKAIKNDITIVSYHTNLDIAKDGLNDNFAAILGLKDVKSLELGKDLGLGRYGYVDEIEFDNFVEMVKQRTKASGIVCYGNTEKLVKKVGLCGGAGSSLINDAIKLSCDVFITGDVSYHTGMDMSNEGISILDVGHFASEDHVVYKLKEEIENIINKEVFTYSKTDSFRKFY